MELRRRVSATLEVESGANDPMAVFLAVTLVSVIGAGAHSGYTDSGLVLHFLWEFAFGAAAGIVGGAAIAWTANRLELAAGLYPVMVVAAALVIYGGTQVLGG